MSIVVTLVFLVIAFVLGQIMFAPIWSFALALVVASIAGSLAGRVVRGRGYGFAGNVAIGLIGVVIGNLVLWVLGLGHLGEIFLIGNILVGVIGALIAVMIVRIFHNADFAR